MKFLLEIELGNDAMRIYPHLRAALRRVIEQMRESDSKPNEGDGRKIMDANGNTVGKWEVIDDTPASTTLAGTPRLSDEEAYRKAEKEVARAERSTRRNAGYRD